jgi:glycosyltransferase involved in cell wall biosynthesis
LFPGEEDFGMVPLEVNAAGRPVIAYHGGGAIETVVPGVTGVFFKEPKPDSLIAAIEDFETRRWHQPALRRHAESFDRKVFSFRVLEFLGKVAPATCANELLDGAQILSQRGATRAWPRLAVAR